MTTVSQFEALPEWEQRLDIRCVVEDDRREFERIKNALEYISSIWCGPSTEPTPENPVTIKSYRQGDHEVTEKTITDFDFDERVEKLREESIALKKETDPLVEELRKAARAKMNKGTNG